MGFNPVLSISRPALKEDRTNTSIGPKQSRALECSEQQSNLVTRRAEKRERREIALQTASR